MTRRRKPREPVAANARAKAKPDTTEPIVPSISAPESAGTSGQWLIPVLLVIIGVAAYASSFDGAFVLDDNPRIVDNEQIRTFWPPWKAMAQSSRPVVQVTLAFNYALGGANPWSYHAFNLIVHVLAGLVLLGLVREMLESPKLQSRYGSISRPLAFAVAGIWLAHPLQTESVTYIIQRAESLMGLLFLLTLYCAARALRSAHPGRWGVAAIAACALGMGTKEVMVSAPLLVVVYDWVFAQGAMNDPRRRRWPLYCALAATWMVLAALLVNSRIEEDTVLVAGLNPLTYAWTQCEVIVHYLRLVLWPSPLVLDYAWKLQESPVPVLPYAAILVALLAGTAYTLARRMWAGFWGAWFFLILAPTSSIMPVADIAFEHRMYLPLAAVVAVVVKGSHDLLRLLARRMQMADRKLGWLEAVLVCAAIIALGTATFRRNDDYRSELAMWIDIVAKRPDNPRAHNNLGVALVKLGRTGDARVEYAEAVRLKPDYVDARNNLGAMLLKEGRIDEAIAQFREAVRIRPAYADAQANLGTALARAGRVDEAIDHLSRAVSLNPAVPQTHNELGNVLYGQGRIKEALVQYSEAVRLQPGFAEAHHNLGLAMLEAGNSSGALTQFSEAIRLKPDYAKARNNLGILLFQQGRRKEAVTQFAEAVRLDPGFAEARRNLQAAEAGR